jgi:hypothetical protein
VHIFLGSVSIDSNGGEIMKARSSFIVILLFILVFSCSALAAWTEPEPIVEINTEYQEKSPFLSFDGLTLYFSIEDGPGWHYTRIYQATRTEPFGYFTSVQEISSLNYSSRHVDYPWVSPDNLRMYYYIAGSGPRTIMITERTSIFDSWRPGVGITELNALGDVATPSLTRDELRIVFAGGNLPDGLGGYDIYMAERPDRHSPFTNIVNLTEINSSMPDVHPSISPDGLTLYFASDRNGTRQLFKATRDSLDAPFNHLEQLSFFDASGSFVSFPCPSHDGSALYFNRKWEDSSRDIYVSYYYPDATCFVDSAEGNDLNIGTTPETAVATIQRAINLVENGFTVLVSPGVYTEKIDLNGKAITVQGLASPAGIPVLEVPDDFAVSFFNNEGPDSVLKNFIIRNSLTAIFVEGGSPTISNITIVDNRYGIIACSGTQPDISNCIFWNNLNGDLIGCQARYSCTIEADSGQNNIYTDPLFADPNNGDYHLLSERGRYWPEHNVWVLDNVTSPCVDGGDPAEDASGERMPNGGLINMGAYGGTAYASMSEMPWLDPDVNRDGIVDASDLSELVDKWLEAAGWNE